MLQWTRLLRKDLVGINAKLDERSRYEQSFRQCINLWEDEPAVRGLTFHPTICAMAARLLGADAVRIWHDQALYKEAGGRGTDPHLDHDYWAIAEPRTITAWIPFDGSSVISGAMGYVPGSHKFEVATFANIFTGAGFDLKNGSEARGVAPEYVESHVVRWLSIMGVQYTLHTPTAVITPGVCIR